MEWHFTMWNEQKDLTNAARFLTVQTTAAPELMTPEPPIPVSIVTRPQNNRISLNCSKSSVNPSRRQGALAFAEIGRTQNRSSMAGGCIYRRGALGPAHWAVGRFAAALVKSAPMCRVAFYQAAVRIGWLPFAEQTKRLSPGISGNNVTLNSARTVLQFNTLLYL